MVWGAFKFLPEYEAELMRQNGVADLPASPGVFALRAPYEGIVLVIDERCPARFVNDAKGVADADYNIEFEQHPDPRELYHSKDKGMQLFLQAKATRRIEAEEQLFVDYGAGFWKSKKLIAQEIVTVTEAQLEAAEFSVDEEESSSQLEQEETKSKPQTPDLDLTKKRKPATPQTPSSTTKKTGANPASSTPSGSKPSNARRKLSTDEPPQSSTTKRAQPKRRTVEVEGTDDVLTVTQGTAKPRSKTGTERATQMQHMPAFTGESDQTSPTAKNPKVLVGSKESRKRKPLASDSATRYVMCIVS